MIAFAMQQVIIPTPKKNVMILKDNYLSTTESSSVKKGVAKNRICRCDADTNVDQF